jgi:hypothetical protein
MGEAGAEAIIPLVKTRSGDLGVRSEGNQASPPKVTLVVNNMGQPVTARHETTQVNAQETVVRSGRRVNRNDYGLKSVWGIGNGQLQFAYTTPWAYGAKEHTTSDQDERRQTRQ